MGAKTYRMRCRLGLATKTQRNSHAWGIASLHDEERPQPSNLEWVWDPVVGNYPNPGKRERFV